MSVPQPPPPPGTATATTGSTASRLGGSGGFDGHGLYDEFAMRDDDDDDDDDDDGGGGGDDGGDGDSTNAGLGGGGGHEEEATAGRGKRAVREPLEAGTVGRGVRSSQALLADSLRLASALFPAVVLQVCYNWCSWAALFPVELPEGTCCATATATVTATPLTLIAPSARSLPQTHDADQGEPLGNHSGAE